jgi:hypothetical protein
MTKTRHSWGSMLRTVRAVVLLIVVGGAGLTLPPQTSDMLAYMETAPVRVAVSFQISLLILGISTWYWSRAALAARFGIDDIRRANEDPESEFGWTAFTWLPRMMLAATFLVGVVLAVDGRSYWNAVGAVVFGIVGLTLTIVRPHGDAKGPPPAPRVGICGWRACAQTRLQALLCRAPFGTVPAVVLLVVGFLPLCLGLIEAFSYTALYLPNRLASVFPGPAIAVFLLGLMAGPLTALTFICDGISLQWKLGDAYVGPRRPPVLTLALIYIFVLVPQTTHIHTVRLLDLPLSTRQPLHDLFDAWARVCAPKDGPIEPVIVAMSGGATMAGLWGASVLDRVLQLQRPDGPAVFAISSVSGGSLGAAAALSLMAKEELPCRTVNLAALQPVQGKPVPLAGDALGPLLGGWLIDDIPRASVELFAGPIRSASGHHPDGGDSAEALEHAFSRLWEDVRPNGSLPWDKSFLSLFYTDNAGTYRKGMPLWFANGTDATTGNRVITAPIAPQGSDERSWPFRGARDFHSLMHADVRIETAINNTARFPYLEPFGEMLSGGDRVQVGSLIDGGYFENEGLQTALDLAEWLSLRSTASRPVLPIIVQATAGGDTSTDSNGVMTCDRASDGPLIPGDGHGLYQILAPLSGLYHVRGGHSAVLLRQAKDNFCRPGKRRFAHFYLPANHGSAIPINWQLSDSAARFIWGHSLDGDDDKGAFSDKPVKNQSELEQLRQILTPLTMDETAPCRCAEGRRPSQ